MDPDLMWPEEREIRELIILVPQADGSIKAVDLDPERCDELRAIIEEKWRAIEDTP